MRWSTKPHELPDGTTVEGIAAAVARSLDAFDPLSDAERNTLTEGQTREEILNFLDDFRWCPDLSIALKRGVRDMWVETTEDDLYVHITAFLSARIVWAVAALASAADDQDLAKRAAAYLKFAKRSDTTAMARKMRDDVKPHRRVGVESLNRGKEALGTPSGVLLLDEMAIVADAEEAQAFRDNEPVNYSLLSLNITKSTGAELSTDFTPTSFYHIDRWDKFIDEICDGDSEKAAFLQRALGYSLYGGNPEKATFVLWGPTRDNGKSTLMNAVKLALGDYADTAPAGLLLVNRNESYTSANPVLAKLVGKRLVDVSEPPTGAELNGAMVKQLASGVDPVSTRPLFGKEFSYVPDFTLWMHCNALPVVRDPTAIDPRHMFVIEFTRSFGPDERDPDLWDEITSRDGLNTIMEWLLDGYEAWSEGGLNPPESVTEATRAWLWTSGTWLDRFVEEMCVVGTAQSCEVAEFKAALAAYCAANDFEPMTMKAVNAYLRGLNVFNKPSHGRRLYRGISVTDALPAPPEGEQAGCSQTHPDRVPEPGEAVKTDGKTRIGIL